MTVAVAPTESEILAALRAFLLGILPAGVDVIKTQVNRVPEPIGANFVLMTPIRRNRISTNVDDEDDAVFTGSIAGDVMTIAAVEYGALGVGTTMFGTGVAAGTVITALGSGSGGTGTYTVLPSQSALSQELSAGAENKTQATMLAVQIDVHGPLAGDNAQIISTLFRDEYAIERFTESGIDVRPLYADDPHQAPFINDQNQYEDRWVVEAVLQANEIVTVPQQYADIVEVDVVSVDATYPP